LQEEKNLNEGDFKQRYDVNLRTIQNLKSDIELLKKDYNEISAANGALRNENKNVNDVIDSRTIEVGRLNDQLDDLDD